MFSGFEIPENIKLNRLNLEALTEDLEKAKNNIRMQVAQAYVQILYDQEMSAVAQRQIDIDSMQVVRLTTLATSRLTATQAVNKCRLSILALTQLLELPTPDGFAVVSPDMTEVGRLEDISLITPDDIYAEALTIKPEIRSEQLRLQGSEHSINIAKAGYYPKLNFSAGLGSNYYTSSAYDSEPTTLILSANRSRTISVSSSA